MLETPFNNLQFFHFLLSNLRNIFFLQKTYNSTNDSISPNLSGLKTSNSAVDELPSFTHLFLNTSKSFDNVRQSVFLIKLEKTKYLVIFGTF